MKVDKALVKKTIEEMIPIHKFLGLEIIDLKRGYAKVKVPFREEVIGDIRKRRWHGGIIATIMDSVGGMAGGTYITTLEDKLSTIDLRIDYLKGAEAKPLIVEGEIVRLGNRILVTNMRAFHEDNEKEILAEAKGVYNFIRLADEGEKDIWEKIENQEDIN